jgi:hypothetical protein
MMQEKIFIQHLFPETNVRILEILNGKINLIKERLNNFETLHKQLFNDSHIKDPVNKNAGISRSKLASHFQSTIDWIKSEESDSGELFQNLPWDEWQKWEITALSNLPEILELPYPESLSTQTPEKSFAYYVLKRPLYNFKSSAYYKKEKQGGEGNVGRMIPTHDFIRYYLMVPVSEFILSQWQKIVHINGTIFYQVHQATESLKDEMLLAQKLESGEAYWKELEAHQPESILQNYQDIIPKMHEMLRVLEDNIEFDLEEFINNLINKINIQLEIAGSPLLPQRKFSIKNSQKKMRLIEKRFKKMMVKWSHESEAIKAEWLKNLELSFLQISAADIYFETREIIDRKVQNKIVVIFEEIKDVVLATHKKFRKVDESQVENLRNLLLVENVTLVKLLRQQKLPELLDTILQANIEKTFKGYFSRIESMVDELSDDHIIFTDRDTEHLPPNSKSTEIRLKEIVQEEIITSSFKDINDLIEIYELKKTAITRGISNLDQIVEFNLDAAANLLKERDDDDAIAEAKQIAVDGLERTLTNLEDMQSTFIQDIDSNSKLFSEIVRDFELDIQKLGDNEKIIQLKLRLAHAKTKEKIISIQKRVWKDIINFLPLILKSGTGLIKRINNEVRKIRKVTGLSTEEADPVNTVTRFLITTHKKIDSMPYIYKRLFSTEPLEEKRFLFARDEYIEQLKEDFENFLNGYQVATVIIAEKGNGKTTLLNFAENEIIKGYNIIKIDLSTTIYEESDLLDVLKIAFETPDVESLEQLELQLQDSNTKKICICENLHNLFLRIIDGFDALERFMLFIMNTRYKIFWITTSGLYAWEYLDRFLRISDNFIRVIYLNVLSRAEIEEVILKRHDVSGYRLLFQENEKILRNRQYKKLTSPEDQQKLLNKMFFDTLWLISGGNIKSALLFWLSAIIRFEEGTIEISSEIKMDHSLVLQLPADEIFSLAAIIEHEYISVEEHALVFNYSRNESKFLIERLYRKGYLAKVDNDYSVNPFLYRPVVQALKSRNILN